MRLLQLLQAGNSDAAEAAWQAFVRQYSDVLLRAARRGARSEDDSLNRYAYVLEHLHANGFRRLRRFRLSTHRSFERWLYTVARRLCADHDRARYGRRRWAGQDERWESRRRLMELQCIDIDRLPIADDAPDAEQTASAREISAALRRAVARLPAEDRQLLKARFQDGCTARQIAEATSFPSEFHVYRALSRLTRTLRRSLEAHGIGDPRP